MHPRVEMTPRPPYVLCVTILTNTAERKMGTARIRLEEIAQTHEVVVCWHEEQDSRRLVGVGGVLMVAFQGGKNSRSEVFEAIVGVGAGVDGGRGLETCEGLFDGAADAEREILDCSGVGRGGSDLPGEIAHMGGGESVEFGGEESGEEDCLAEVSAIVFEVLEGADAAVVCAVVRVSWLAVQVGEGEDDVRPVLLEHGIGLVDD